MELTEATTEDIVEELRSRPFQFHLLVLPEISEDDKEAYLPEDILKFYASDFSKEGAGTVMNYGLLIALQRQRKRVVDKPGPRGDVWFRFMQWHATVSLLVRDMLRLTAEVDGADDDEDIEDD